MFTSRVVAGGVYDGGCDDDSRGGRGDHGHMTFFRLQELLEYGFVLHPPP